MDNLFSFLGREPFISIFLLYALYAWIKFIVKKIEERDWFSDKYLKTMYWVFGLIILFAFLGGSLENLKYEFRLALQEPAGLFFSFLPFFIGSLIGATLITLFITYVVRLIIPFLKKIHDFTND